MIGYNDTSALTVAAAGSTQATATPLTSRFNAVTTVAASAGVSLPANAAPGTVVFVQNGGANALSVYPATATGTINGGAAGAAVSLATTSSKTKNSQFVSFGNDNWAQYISA